MQAKGRLFENRILRRIFGFKRNDSREWRTEELHSLYRSPNVVRVNKYRILRWAGHVAKIEKVGILSKFYFQEGLWIGGRPILEWISKKLISVTMNWADKFPNMDYWRFLVNAALNVRISIAME